jgi:CHASE1-domain containing sensor protein
VRQTLATVVAALFIPPPLAAPAPLGDFGNQILALIPDVRTVGWLPEISAADAADALKALKDAGVENPRFLGRDGQPLAIETLGRPLYPILDVAPKRNRIVLGVDAGAFPERLAAINRARETREVVRTDLLHLVQSPDSNALLIYAPVFTEGKFRGVLGFGYQIDQLFVNALKAPRVASGYDIRVYSGDSSTPLLELSAEGTLVAPHMAVADARATTIERKTDFAGRDLRFVYTSPRDLSTEAVWQGVSFATISLALTGAVVGFFGFLANRAAALAGEVSSRRSAEERLKMLIHELNHRVRNVLSVAQAVVRLSFTAGYSLSEVQKTCEGRSDQ